MTNDYSLALMTGVDIPIPECQLVLHQPTIKEISQLGEHNFFQGISYLCIDKSNLQHDPMIDISSIDNFQLLMESIKQKPEIKDYILNALVLLLPKYKINFTPRSIIATLSAEDNTIIDNENFNSLQAIIRMVLCINETDSKSYNPANQQAAEIAQKLLKARQRVAALKNAEEKSSGSSLAQFLSVLTIGQGSVSLHEAIGYTLYQLYDLIQRHNLFVSWDIDLRARLAGGKPEKQPDNWMKKIH